MIFDDWLKENEEIEIDNVTEPMEENLLYDGMISDPPIEEKFNLYWIDLNENLMNALDNYYDDDDVEDL